MTRVLASVQRISDIAPIDGADNIECAKIKGWTTVVGKNTFKKNDLCVFFEIDSFLRASDERFKFLEKRFIDWKGMRGCRIKTMKLRGVLSQGLALPLESFPEVVSDMTKAGLYVGPDNDSQCVGWDVTSLLNIQKWEPDIPPQLFGKVRGNFPYFLVKTDQERVQNLMDKITSLDPEEVFEITQKLDGSSMTMYLYRENENEEFRFGVCSRNLDLEETEDNTFWKVARTIQAETRLRNLIEILNPVNGIAVQGELMGPGIQGNPENLTEHEFFLFDIFNIDLQGYLSPPNRIKLNDFLGFAHVPIFPTAVKRLNECTLEQFLQMAPGISALSSKQREGIVFKSEKHSFKVISNKYLLEEK